MNSTELREEIARVEGKNAYGNPTAIMHKELALATLQVALQLAMMRESNGEQD